MFLFFGTISSLFIMREAPQNTHTAWKYLCKTDRRKAHQTHQKHTQPIEFLHNLATSEPILMYHYFLPFSIALSPSIKYTSKKNPKHPCDDDTRKLHPSLPLSHHASCKLWFSRERSKKPEPRLGEKKPSSFHFASEERKRRRVTVLSSLRSKRMKKR